jgi:V8-like Glu-specific endopeptidase
VYVIGHPRAGGLQMSLHDSLLLARDRHERLLHYRTPTEAGNSGSPVFNEDWNVLALHHGGSANMPRLHPEAGFYEANEGILLKAIQGGWRERSAAPPVCKPGEAAE